MPSGSHGGHSHSGGSRVGGHSSGGFGGSRGSLGPRRPWRFHFGRHYYIVPMRYSGLMSFFSVILIFAAFLTFAGWMIFSQAQGDMAAVVRDYQRYQAMIAKAHEDPNLLVDGWVENYYFDESADKYYITYEFPTLDGGTIRGESYSLYTLQDLEDAGYDRPYTPIKIAVDRIPETEYTDVDSVPMDYEDMTLEDDGFYMNAKGTYQFGRTMCIIAGVVFGACIVLNIVVFCVTKKKADTDGNLVDGNTTTTTTTTTATAQPTASNTPKYCDYCGVRLGDQDTKCPACGAKVKK